MSLPKMVSSKDFFEAEQKVLDWYGNPAIINRNGNLHSEEYFRGMRDAFDRLEVALGFYPQILYELDKD